MFNQRHLLPNQNVVSKRRQGFAVTKKFCATIKALRRIRQHFDQHLRVYKNILMMIQITRLVANHDNVRIGKKPFPAFAQLCQQRRTAEDFGIFETHSTGLITQFPHKFVNQIGTNIAMRWAFASHVINYTVQIFVAFFGLSFKGEVRLNCIQGFFFWLWERGHSFFPPFASIRLAEVSATLVTRQILFIIPV